MTSHAELMQALETTGTLLEFRDGAGIPFYSCFDATQTIYPIGAIRSNRQNLVRTVAGTLIDLTPTIFRKYGSKISCTSVEPPAFDGWPGTTFELWCCAEMSYPVGGHQEREEVHGSYYEDGHGFIRYRPIFPSVMVIDYEQSFREWAHDYSWSLEVEEV